MDTKINLVRLHNGHRKLLTLAAGTASSALVVGITGDAMLSKKANAHAIRCFTERAGGVAAFLSDIKPTPSLKPELVELLILGKRKQY